jgi:hypothetical protein
VFRRSVVFCLQGAYYVVTGIWPLVSMGTFEALTGEKTDDWLVRMVGLLAAVIGITLLVAARSESRSKAILLLSVSSAAAFLAIDVVYWARGVLEPIYLADAALEGILLLAVSLAREPRRAASAPPLGAHPPRVTS